ncbi:MAG: hypothetical protein AMJ68_02760 [Acidithiobacillales bacterium SG8_45]|jgi:ABC-type uncharacterized transport system involved in gliding motility auxiliary subunit|nr:MAG: hypothetical protein AMJ68_02760 [Acidithiobacillales bacterium SG8_45]
MKVTAKSLFNLRLAGASFVFLALLVAGLILWLSNVYRAEIDLTRSGRNSLSDASIELIQRLDKPLKVTAFTGDNPELRANVDQLVQSYRRYKKDIELSYVDPNTDPQQVREAGIRYYSQLLLEYEGSKEVLAELNEEAMTNAITRLGHRGERWLVFLTGHGERQPDREANFDLSRLAEHLRQRGFRTRGLSLAEIPQIPQNTSVLVIAGPQVPLLAGEVKKIQAYVEEGGNLLWMMDPGPLHGLDPLAEQLGIEFEAGTIVDEVSQQITGSATALVIAEYGTHPAVTNFHANTVFPNACAITIPEGDAPAEKQPEDPDAEGNWQHQVLIDTRTAAWSETGPLNRRITFDKGKDLPGPLNLAVAATRNIKDKEQRVAVICDGDFASNAFVLGNGGNLDFAMSIANWLSHDDAYINVPVRTVSDQVLQLSGTTRTILMLLFVFVIPLSLVASGIAIWLRRRKR